MTHKRLTKRTERTAASKHVIDARSSLAALERLLLELQHRPALPSRIVVERRRGKQLFKGSAIATLLQTVGTAGELNLQISHWDADDLESSEKPIPPELLVGLTHCASLAISPPASFEPVPDVLARRIASERQGLLERQSGGLAPGHTKTLTFFALDPDFLDFYQLGITRTLREFDTDIAFLKGRYIVRAIGNNGVDNSPDELLSDRAVYTLIWELLRNTHEHGASTGFGPSGLAVRWLTLRRHVLSRSEIDDCASEFPPLADYLDSTLPGKGPSRSVRVFYEMSLFDHGQGILTNFCERTDSPMPSSSQLRCSELNRIISDGLSSKELAPGAGKGLQRSLYAVARLGGFVTLRTDDQWLFFRGDSVTVPRLDYRSVRQSRLLEPPEKLRPSLQLSSCSAQQASFVIGTRWNLIFPVSEARS
jgi:hypothetical protein